MDLNDRVLLSYFLRSFGIEVGCFAEDFAQQLYEGLWQLADCLHSDAQIMEKSINQEAIQLIN